MRFSRVLAASAALVAGALMALPSASAQSAAVRIHLLHGIPGTDVDVEAGGSNVFSAFKFGEVKDLSALAGTTLVGLKVKAAGTSTVAIDAGDTKLPATGNYTIVAHLDAAGKPALAVFENDTSTIAAGKGRLVVRHGAAAPAVDVRAGGAVAFANLVNGKEGKADLAVGTVSADVVPTGATTPVVIGPTDLAIKDGVSLIVYAVGSLDAKTLTVATESITGLGTNPTAVQTGNSPIDESGSSVLPITVAALLGLLGAGSLVALRRRAH
jgi:MYXO-CTERM domain-containing protein